MTVHRGYDGNRPTRLSATLPVKDGVTILSGQIMSIARNTTKGINEWVRGYDAAVSQPNSFYVAFDDSADGDVRAAGNLQGLSVRGQYELSTAHTKAAENYQAGDELTYDGVTGNFKTALEGDIVIAHVVKDYSSPVDLAASYTPAPGTATVSDGVQGGAFTIATHSNAENLTRVRIELVSPYLKPEAG
jgi:hypothetical protein